MEMNQEEQTLLPPCRKQKSLRTYSCFLLIALLLCLSSTVWGAEVAKLTAPPVGERWFSVKMGGDRVGFAHLVITPVKDGYCIQSDASVKMLVMGFSREASGKETYLVGRDLSLKSFYVEQTIDKSRSTVKGEALPKGVHAVIETAGGRKEKTLKTKGAVYPPPVINFVPLMQGGSRAKTYSVPMLDVETVKMKQVKVTVVGPENLDGTQTVHLKNNLYPFVDNDIWVDLQGNSIKESVRDDLVLTTAEDEKSAKAYLADAALAKKDLILDFSLIKTDRPIERPAELKRLTVDLVGMGQELPTLQGTRQQAQRVANDTTRFILSQQSPSAQQEPAPSQEDLEPSQRIQSDNAEIVAQKDAIVGGEKDPAVVVERLVAWVSKEIKGTVTDSLSPVETLKTRDGNCQSHSRLYAALARAAKVPTRFVSGIVYAPGQGFLYHSWAESYLGGGWMPVDPTFNQKPADLTHIKLADGDTVDDMAILAGVIGKVKAKVVEQQY